MATPNLIAKAETIINASTSAVWNGLTNADTIKKYMFGTTVVSDWKEGSSIVWKGEWKGKPYEDKGKIVQMVPLKLLEYTHFSPLTGQADLPENYHTVTIELADQHGQTMVSLSQNNNRSEEEKKHSEQNWSAMLHQLKQVLEDACNQ